MNIHSIFATHEARVRIVKFGLVGCLNTAVDFGVFLLLYYVFNVPILWANSASCFLAILNSFFFNRQWTFADRSNGTGAFSGCLTFVSLNFVGLMIANAMVWLFSRLLPVPLAKVVSIGITMIWNYWASDKFAFPDRIK